jgi:hypothetical protein
VVVDLDKTPGVFSYCWRVASRLHKIWSGFLCYVKKDLLLLVYPIDIVEDQSMMKVKLLIQRSGGFLME